MFEEPEEPVPEEEIPEEPPSIEEEPPSIEEIEEVAPPRGTTAFMSWTFKIHGVQSLSQNSSKPNVHRYIFLASYP